MLAYPESDCSRDLRVDFLRGVVMFVLITVHVEIFSLFNFLTWERVGLISGAEGFVLFSGVVLGQLHRKTNSFEQSSTRSLTRAVQLYRINIMVILIIMLASFNPWIDFSVVMTFKDWYSGNSYDLFPPLDSSWFRIVHRVLLLKSGPHQIQILGLYFILLGLTPIFLLFLIHKKSLWLLAISWIFYFQQLVEPSRPTGAQFEYAFPVMAWQVLYVHALTLGYYRFEISTVLSRHDYSRMLLIGGSMLLALIFFLLAQNSPNSAFPDWARLNWVEPEQFNHWHNQYFSKNKLGILRLVNYFVVMVSAYWVLTRYWKNINKVLGWLFIPLGQASLYVFIMHLIFVVLIAQIPGLSNLKPTFAESHVVLNTIAHTSIILLLWWMVKQRFLYRFVPR